MVKALFIFSGVDRRELEPQVEAGNWPDNWFYGYTQAKKHPGIQAEYLQVTKGNFKGNLLLLLSHYRKFSQADVIFITSSLHFSLVLAKRFGLLRRQKWLLLNLDLTSKLSRSNRLLGAVRLADKILSPSRVQNEFLVGKGVGREALTFFEFGIDKEFYHALPAREEGIVFAVGRDPGRDYKTLMEAVARMDVSAVIMCRARNIESVALKPQNVEIVDEKTPLETREYYERSLVSVVPSYSSEKKLGSDCSGQTAILESMGYGRPVIATRKEWFVDYFEEGRHLLVVPPDDSGALRSAIERIYSDKNLRDSLTREGHKLIGEKYHSEKMGERIAELILGIV